MIGLRSHLATLDFGVCCLVGNWGEAIGIG